jgi:hypothetical protein
LVAGRLSFFIIADIENKTDHCNQKGAEQEKGFPSHVHRHHLPQSRKAKQKRYLTSSGIEEATATV